jgi:protein-disulfide isomerase
MQRLKKLKKLSGETMAKKTNPGVFITFVAIAGIVLGIILITSPEKTTAPSSSETQQIVATDKQLYRENAPYTGNKNGTIKVVIFSDYLCPYCKNFSSQMDELVKKYPELVVYHRTFEIHSQAEIMARAAEAANLQGKFAEANTLIFNDYQEAKTEDDLLPIAKKLGIDETKFKNDLADQATANKVESDSATAREINLRGTPSVFVNGKYLEDPAAIESTIKSLI